DVRAFLPLLCSGCPARPDCGRARRRPADAFAMTAAHVHAPGVRPPRHVLVFIHSLHGGGAERVAADLTARWAEAGRRVTLVTQAGAEDDAYDVHPAVERVVLGTAGDTGGGLRGLAANVRRVRALRACLRRCRPDVVLGMMTTASVLAVLAARGLPCR